MADEHDAGKDAAARAALTLVRAGMCVGLGTGSTASRFVRALGERVRTGLAITAVCTSRATEDLARKEGITVVDLDRVGRVDLAVDGADAVDPRLDLVKGYGGALFREKMVALAAERFVVVVDAAKPVESLAHAGRVPVETVRFGVESTSQRIAELGLRPELHRGDDGQPFVTDNGCFVVFAHFVENESNGFDAARLATALKSITGVVEHGFFLDITTEVLVGEDDGSVRRLSR